MSGLIRTIKAGVRQTLASGFHYTAYYQKRLRGKLLILTYHRVFPKKEDEALYVQSGMVVQQESFESQMEFLKANFDILSFRELLSLWERKEWDVNRRYCVITFDDGWLDNYLYAFPVLKRLDLPATIFLPIDFIGKEEWFWTDKLGFFLQHYFSLPYLELRDRSSRLIDRYPWFKEGQAGSGEEKIDGIIERCKHFSIEEREILIEELREALDVQVPKGRMFLNWKEVNEMAGHGVSFGSHSSKHHILTQLHLEQVRAEVEESLSLLRKKAGNYIPVFCYPNGDYSPEILHCVREAGYLAAVTTEFGFEKGFPQNRYALKRISIHHDITATVPLFSFHVSGFNHLLKFQF